MYSRVYLYHDETFPVCVPDRRMLQLRPVSSSVPPVQSTAYITAYGTTDPVSGGLDTRAVTGCLPTSRDVLRVQAYHRPVHAGGCHSTEYIDTTTPYLLYRECHSPLVVHTVGRGVCTTHRVLCGDPPYASSRRVRAVHVPVRDRRLRGVDPVCTGYETNRLVPWIRSRGGPVRPCPGDTRAYRSYRGSPQFRILGRVCTGVHHPRVVIPGRPAPSVWCITRRGCAQSRYLAGSVLREPAARDGHCRHTAGCRHV